MLGALGQSSDAKAPPLQPTSNATAAATSTGFGITTAAPAGGATTVPQSSQAAQNATTAVLPNAPAATSAAAPVGRPTDASAIDFSALLARDTKEGVMSDLLKSEIHRRFNAPMMLSTVTATAPATGSLSVPPVAGPLGAATQPSWNSGGISSGLATAANVASPSATVKLGLASESSQRQLHSQLAATAEDFLQTLLLCDSGFNNSVVASVEEKELIKGLHAAVGSVAVSASSNLIAFIKKSITPGGVGGGGGGATAAAGFTSSLGIGTRGKGTYKDPVLLAVQCLYLLARHFQLTASVVKEGLEVLDTIATLVKRAIGGRSVNLDTFSDSSDTRALSAFAWLYVFSLVNMIAVWKKVRSNTGTLQLNALIQSDVASSVDAAIVLLRKKLRNEASSTAARDEEVGRGFIPSATALGQYGGNLSTPGGLASSAGRSNGGLLDGKSSQRSPVQTRLAVDSWQSVVESYLSILLLAQGCLLHVKGNDQGYDKALEAFLGDRVATPFFISYRQGKVTKRMVQLAPSPQCLTLPIGYIYIAPYEMMSFLFDDMLPLLHHVSELEVATLCRYVEQLEELPRYATNARKENSSPGAGFTRGEEGPMQSSPWSTSSLSPATSQGGHPLDVPQMGEPFSSEMAHLLEGLATCLQHLPPGVLNPDLESDCAATFFIFKNCVKHMRHVFQVQRSTWTIWENFTLKLITKFLHVLAMIGRHPQYTERIATLLTGAQAECPEMQWQSLLCQALECAGFNSAVIMTSGSGVSNNELLSVSATSPIESLYVDAVANGRRTVHLQFTREYAYKSHRMYISSFFLLLRQFFAHPTLRSLVSECVTLELALTFLFAPHQSQTTLGSTLSLISGLVTCSSEAALVWSFLDQHRLLQPAASLSTQRGLGGRPSGTLSSVSTAAAGLTTDGSSHEESLSLIGHCQYECTQGTYAITAGFLNLVIALFHHDAPTMASLPLYSTVTIFIAQEIVRGILKRVFVREQERYSVLALAAAALRQALQVRFCGDGGGIAVLPFASVMATSKAPADVLGEILLLILDASDATYELPSHHRAAARHCLRLLIAAIESEREQKLELFSFDARTTQNTNLAVRIMTLCTAKDTLLMQAALQLLALFPFDTASQAARYWNAEPARYGAARLAFEGLLHPENYTPVLVQAPPDLAHLDAELTLFSDHWPDSLMVDTKALLLDVLIKHAVVLEPSLTAWVCGFYGDVLPRSDRTRLDVVLGRNEKGTAPQWWSATLLTSIVVGAESRIEELSHPHLAVKYVKLLYLLRANQLYGSTVARPFIESICHSLFLRLQQFRAKECTPLALSKYAYVLKLLALETCYTYRISSDTMQLDHANSFCSIAVEVLLSLLRPRATVMIAKGEVSSPSGVENRDNCDTQGSIATPAYDIAAEITAWLPQALSILPVFPENLPYVGASTEYLVTCATDGVVQYNMGNIYDHLQREQARAAKGPLSVLELKEKLRPYIHANDCFLSYTSAVHFVEGWCQVVSISTSVVKNLPLFRLQDFALCILRGLDATVTMMVAAQEQVAIRLCNCLSTVMAQLRDLSRATAHEVPLTSLINGASDQSEERRGEGTRQGEHQRGHGQPLQETVIGHRRGRDSAEGLNSSKTGNTTHSVQRNLFSTAAGNTSNLCSSVRRTQLTRSLRESKTAAMPITPSLQNALLGPLVTAVVRWGTRIPAIRSDMYLSLLCLADCSGVTLDNPVLWRSQKTLLDLVCSDICDNALPALHKQHATTVLVALLQHSNTLRDAFCSPITSSDCGLGTLPLRCASALFAGVDAAVAEVLAHSSTNLGALFWRIRTAFDYLAAISVGNESQIVQSNLVPACFSMKAWQYSTPIILGYSNVVAEQFVYSKEQLGHNKEVLRCLLLGAIRWCNVLLSALSDAPPLLYAVQAFIRENRPLVEYILISPTTTATTAGALQIAASHLLVCAELSDCLRMLSSSATLAVDCRSLVGDMALPELLLAVTGECLRSSTSVGTMDDLYDIENTVEETMLNVTSELAGLGQKGKGPRHHTEAMDRRKDLLALTARNIAHFLLHTEYGSRSDSTAAGDIARSIVTIPMLRDFEGRRQLVVAALGYVANCITQSCVDGSSATTDGLQCASQNRIENYIYAAHALVCLIHSFVLPLGTHLLQSSTFTNYLASLALGEMEGVLVQVQDALYQLKVLNTDYRSGVRGSRNETVEWAGGASQTLSNGMRLASKAEQSQRDSFSHNSQRQEQVSVPSTPAITPSSGNRLMGTTKTSPNGEDDRRGGAAKGEGLSRPSVPAGVGNSAGPPDPSSTLVLDLSATQGSGRTKKTGDGYPSDAAPNDRSGERWTPSICEESRLQKEDSLWDLLPNASSSSAANGWTQIYESVQDSRNDTWSSLVGLQWSDVLSMEHEVRLVKIAIANALRAVKVAKNIVQRNTQQ